MRRFLSWLVVGLGLTLTVPPAFAAQEIKVPFNFQWGESAQRLETSLKSVKAEVVERKDVRGRMCLVVKGIPQKLLIEARFYFENDALNEIELHYGDDTWAPARYDTFFQQTRRNIESKYGIGRVVAREKTQEHGISQSLTGYQWSQPVTTLSLYYYTATQAGNDFHLLSLHYRGF